jgi:para-nitrobenzyl esterase
MALALTTVSTKYGALRGVLGENSGNAVFKGIPYAKPPVRALRFQPPQEPRPWEGELRCCRYAPSAIQREPFEDPEVSEISEDSLYLNVWTPASDPGEKLPVMFWLHGGGFIAGSGASREFDGAALNRHGVILVTANYRLGALGFLALPELAERDGTTGNSGLLDQVAALKWVHGNIAAFGGDPGNITVFGFSAGGMSTRMLMCSPLARGLIRRVIVQSGGGISDSDYYRPLGEKMAICRKGMDRLGWSVEDIMEREAGEVADALHDATRDQLEFWEKSVFQPDVDGRALTDSPGVSIWNGCCPDIPVIAGSVSGDIGWLKIVRGEIADESMIPAFVYSRGVAWAIRQIEAGRRPIYTYHFERSQPENRWRGEGNRTPHGSEVAYVMGTLNREDFGEYDYALSAAMTGYWANFAKTGEPNGDGLKEWPPFTAERPVSMHFTDEGFEAEKLMKTPASERAVRFVANHPGVIKSLKGL